MSDQFENHIFNKTKVREQKDTDKQLAKQNNTLTVACFDLQEVLLTPKGFASSFYYKRRLNNYNFTIYNLGNSDGRSFLWNETIAGRGSNEIASCVYHFIKEHAGKGTKSFIFYSDNCFSQNKNRNYITMLWYSLKKFNLSSIEHKYLEKGHTFNENDSIHAAIENVSRNIVIYTTAQWATAIQTARSKKPYIVRQMSLADFFDFKLLSENLKNFDLG